MPIPSSELYPSPSLYPSEEQTATNQSSTLVASVSGNVLFQNLEPWQTDDLALYMEGIGAMFDDVYTLVYDVGVDGQSGYVPGWGSLFDPSLCPTDDLPYLAQYVGVSIPSGASDATARQLILAEAGKSRGTPAAVMSAIQRSISTPWEPNTVYAPNGPLVSYGTPPTYYEVAEMVTSGTAFTTTGLTEINIATQYQLLERFNGVTGVSNQGYQTTIVVRPEQLTPTGNTAALVSAVDAVKPGGVVLTVVLTDSVIWSNATLSWSAVSPSVTWGSVVTGQV